MELGNRLTDRQSELVELAQQRAFEFANTVPHFSARDGFLSPELDPVGKPALSEEVRKRISEGRQRYIASMRV